VLEGLDYLACLTSAPNLEQVRGGFDRWQAKPGKWPPPGFDGVVPSRNRRHEVIVLAPRAYFDRFRRSGRGAGWPEFANLPDGPNTDPVSFRFAETDFLCSVADWLAG
jgi:hypothetical protein